MLPAARQRELLGGDADIRTPHPAVPYQLAEHKTRRIGGNRKTDTLRAHDHRGVDPDDLAMGGHERASRIAGIECGVGLDHVVDQPPRARAQRPAEGGNYARRDRRFEPKRIADGDHELPALEQLGIAEGCRRKRHRGIDADEGEVRIGIVADHPRSQSSTVNRGGVHPRGVPDDVTIGEHESVRRDNDARSGAAATLLGVRGHIEAHHRRPDPLDDVDDGAGIGIEERPVIGDNGGRAGEIGVGSVEHEHTCSAIREAGMACHPGQGSGGLGACPQIWGARRR